jgi:hypothetical protein
MPAKNPMPLAKTCRYVIIALNYNYLILKRQ